MSITFTCFNFISFVSGFIANFSFLGPHSSWLWLSNIWEVYAHSMAIWTVDHISVPDVFDIQLWSTHYVDVTFAFQATCPVSSNQCILSLVFIFHCIYIECVCLSFRRHFILSA